MGQICNFWKITEMFSWLILITGSNFDIVAQRQTDQQAQKYLRKWKIQKMLIKFLPFALICAHPKKLKCKLNCCKCLWYHLDFVSCTIAKISYFFWRRKEHKLVHRFEKDESGKPLHLIKEFRRSAAGHFHKNPKELRPPVICLKTAKYLIAE